MTKDEALSAKHEGATTVALKLALEALGHFEKAGLATLKTIDAITAIREVLALSESSTKCEETSHAQPDVDRRSTESKETFDQQEPVAITITGKLGNIYSFTGDYSLKKGDKVYTTPPSNSLNSIKSSNTLDAQRKPLTDEEIIQIASTPDGLQATTKGYVIPFARAIEAAHGIKEN